MLKSISGCVRYVLPALLVLFQFSAAQPDNRPNKCGLPYLLEAVASSKADLPALSRFHKLALTQVEWDSLPSPSGHFMIHYNTTEYDSIPTYDRDNNGTPDYLEFVGKSFDLAWEIEINTLGFNPPPDGAGNPVTVYPIYCGNPGRNFNVPANTYGVTGWDPTQDIPSLPGLNYPSEIWINTDFSFIPDYLYEHITGSLSGQAKRIVRDSLAIAVTAAHEFNHALQLGYRIWQQGNNFPDLWFIENSATYMEEVVADTVNDYYQYLPAFYNNTTEFLAQDGAFGKIYGEVILNIMLGERFGSTITREIWQEINQQPALPAMKQVLQNKGSGLDEELKQLATWMFFSDDRTIPGRYFPEAAAYPTPAMISQGFDQSQEITVTGTLPPLAFRFYQVDLSVPGNMSVFLAVDSSPQFWESASFTFLDPFVSFFPSNTLLNLPAPPTLRYYLLVFSGGWGEDQNIRTAYELRLQQGVEINPDQILVYPNLISPQQPVSRVTFANLPEDARIEIFTGNGLHIATVRPENMLRVAFWDLLTNDGKAVASGVYIYRVVSATKSYSGKIMVVR